jgi:hypothetical protein
MHGVPAFWFSGFHPDYHQVTDAADKNRLFKGSFLPSLCLQAGSVARLKWTDASGWTNEASRPMRAATYNVPPAAGDREPSDCVVYFFGPGQGGSAEANIQRRNGQVLGLRGQAADAKVKKQIVQGLTETTIDTSGDYTGMGGPMRSRRAVQRATGCPGAVIEGPDGNVFVKFAGPAKTMAANEPKFQPITNSFEKAK